MTILVDKADDTKDWTSTQSGHCNRFYQMMAENMEQQ